MDTRNTLFALFVTFHIDGVILMCAQYESNGAKMQENKLEQKRNNYESTEYKNG